MALVKVSEIAARLGVSRCTAWRWSRRGRFGEPVDSKAGVWKFHDTAALALCLQICQGKEPVRVWRLESGRLYHQRRLGRYVAGELDTDGEDLEMASLLLNLAARQFERRAAGVPSPCAVSAEFVGRQMLSKNRAGDPLMGQRMKGTAARLAAMAEKMKGSGQDGN